jgi:hypothetical protein
MMDESEIRGEVEKRKKAAFDSGVPKLVLRIFQEKLQPLREGAELRECGFPGTVTAVRVSSRQNGAPYSIELQLRDAVYKFVCEERFYDLSDGKHTNWIIRVRIDNRKVLEINCISKAFHIDWSVANVDEYPLSFRGFHDEVPWRVDSIGAFVDGPWVETIRSLATKFFDESDSLKEELKVKNLAESKQREIQALMRNFGIKPQDPSVS